MKNVMLIGDSIRLGYEGRVRELLGSDVTVFSPGENCRFTKFTLWGMFSWMEEWGNPHIDVIHWNTGIWDLHRCTADGENFTLLDEFVDTNRRLAIQMESYSENLIWATITPGGRGADKLPDKFRSRRQEGISHRLREAVERRCRPLQRSGGKADAKPRHPRK